MGEKEAENAGEFSDEELERYFQEAENEEKYIPFWQSAAVKRILAGIISVMLVANVLAFLPKVFSMPAVQFLSTSARLFQSETIQGYSKAVVVVSAGNRKGTGFQISGEQGIIVTNKHVVGDESVSTITFANGERRIGKVIVRDPDVDIALLSVGPNEHPVLEPADPELETTGKPVVVIGNPLFFNWIANEGKVLSLLEDRNPPMLALQAPIYRGNSGSPVIGEDGRVIGVVFATSTVEVEEKEAKVGLAVPIRWVIKHLEQ
ncbi:trypsin-like peptidase domain-containing protein [Paenibacillus thermotolerans]|uniref:trypsin-like peptidase domain-containing protein n=1 Tax=Paenibacillus thermotolerans TaxID=3027807 RepID=UPI002368D4C2|nr:MULTISPECIES: trypsin-like peptidase domain-containing protein [unclassified Paenibacillus]